MVVTDEPCNVLCEIHTVRSILLGEG